jgi:hypothetical protein
VFITRLLPLLLLIGCGYNKVYKDPSGVYKKDFETLSESPCIDGAIVNIYEAGCEVFYWGVDPEGVVLKMRCTYASKDSMWTKSTFYAVPHNHSIVYSNWFLFCNDRHVNLYSAPQGVELNNE